VDQSEIEKLGIPTITVATSAFISLGRSTMKSVGLPDMAFVEVPHPMAMISLEEIRSKADQSFSEILKMATQWRPSLAQKQTHEIPPYPAERIRFKGTYAALNRMFYERGWSLGLPIIPPTPEAVEAMLEGTAHQPEEIVWVVPPRMGQLTVELIAALGVISGCKPEQMPLLLAVIKALSHRDYDWRGSTTTTAPTAPVIIINGPILDELGIAYSTGALGGQHPVNIALGYFINLVGDVVGGAIPPDLDKSTLGSRGDLVALVLGENEKANPWKQSYAVEHGFKPADNVVTAFSAYPGTNNTDHFSVKGEDLLNTMSLGVAAVACGFAACLTRYDKPSTFGNEVKYVFLFLGPEHADTIHRDFPSKRAVQEYLIKNAVAPYKTYAPGLCTPPKEFGPYTPETMIPRFIQPESIHIVVTGGPGKQSQIWPTFPTCQRPISVLVEG
jgi:hypothetical protein